MVRRACDQPWTGPTGVFDQSMDRMRAPISPPSAKPPSSGEVELQGCDEAIRLDRNSALRSIQAILKWNSAWNSAGAPSSA